MAWDIMKYGNVYYNISKSTATLKVEVHTACQNDNAFSSASFVERKKPNC